MIKESPIRKLIPELRPLISARPNVENDEMLLIFRVPIGIIFPPKSRTTLSLSPFYIKELKFWLLS